MKRILSFSAFALIVCTTFFTDAQGQVASDKKALAILGDFWHGVAPLYRGIVWQLDKKGYTTDIIPDYDVPFERFSEYDLIILSRYYVHDYQQLNKREKDPRKYGWLTPLQEEAFEKFVQDGGKLFFHHDGIGFYPMDGAISRLAKAYFITHPPVVNITVVPLETIPSSMKASNPSLYMTRNTSLKLILRRLTFSWKAILKRTVIPTKAGPTTTEKAKSLSSCRAMTAMLLCHRWCNRLSPIFWILSISKYRRKQLEWYFPQPTIVLSAQ